MIKTYRLAENRLQPLDGVAMPATAGALPSDVVWLDVTSPTAEEDRLVEQVLGISLPTREEMEEIEVSSRLYHEDGAEFMTVTAVVHIDTEQPETTPITFILKDNVLATVRYAESRAFANLVARSQKAGAVQCDGGEQIMMSLIETLGDRMADALEAVGRNIDGISRAVFRRKPGEKVSKTTDELQSIIEKIGRDGDLLTKVRESLVSIARVLTYHTTIELGDKRKAKDARLRAKVLHRDTVALTDQATFLSNKINFLLDATLGLINLQQNQIIKIFSVAAVVFLPPTLVASAYGMNFRYMPELGWVWGYPSAIVLMVVSAILPYMYFKSRGWL
jgi:magnesium transporter